MYFGKLDINGNILYNFIYDIVEDKFIGKENRLVVVWNWKLRKGLFRSGLLGYMIIYSFLSNC